MIQSLDYGTRQFSDTIGSYANENANYSTLPIYIDSDTYLNDETTQQQRDMIDLNQQGWTLL